MGYKEKQRYKQISVLFVFAFFLALCFPFLLATALNADSFKQPVVQIIDVNRPDVELEIGERLPIEINIDYNDVPSNSFLEACITDVESGRDLVCEKKQFLVSKGRYTFSPIHIAPTQGGLWPLRVEIRYRGQVLSTRPVTVRVAMPAEKPASVTIKHLKLLQGEPIAGRSVPLSCTIGYANFRKPVKLRFYISDLNSEASLGWSESDSLRGDGTYVFKPVILIPPERKEWKLKIKISSPLREYKVVLFTLRIRSKTLFDTSQGIIKPLILSKQEVNEPSVSVSSVKKSVGAIVTGQPISLSFEIEYANLSEQVLTLSVFDKHSTEVLASVDSVPLSGKKGNYVFSDLTLIPLTTGDWNLGVRITIGQQVVSQAKFTLKIKK